jgi:hypothetical protein
MVFDCVVLANLIKVSMSDMKHDAIVNQGIKIHERVEIPDELIPSDSVVEIQAKIAAGYYTGGEKVTNEALANITGRGWNDKDAKKDVPVTWDDVNVSYCSYFDLQTLTLYSISMVSIPNGKHL